MTVIILIGRGEKEKLDEFKKKWDDHFAGWETSCDVVPNAFRPYYSLELNVPVGIIQVIIDYVLQELPEDCQQGGAVVIVTLVMGMGKYYAIDRILADLVDDMPKLLEPKRVRLTHITEGLDKSRIKVECHIDDLHAVVWCIYRILPSEIRKPYAPTRRRAKGFTRGEK